MKNKSGSKRNIAPAATAVFLALAICAAAAFLLFHPESGSDKHASSAETGTEEASGTLQTSASEESAEAEETSALSAEELLEIEIEDIISSMTTEEKAAQLFIVKPEDITGVSAVTKAGEISEDAINTYPVGGLVFFSDNLKSESQTREMLSGFLAFSEARIGLPLFLCVDEEGGTISRIANNENFAAENVGNMSEIGATGNSQNAFDAGVTIGTYLSDLGFNVDFAPVADVLTNSGNTVVRYRAFSSDPLVVSEMAAAMLAGLESCGVYGTYKHFPGHGNTSGDTHDGYSYSNRTLDELYECEFIPFRSGIEAGVSFIMVAHIALPNVTGDNTPASMSEEIIGILRDDLGFDGIIITDALDMVAITAQYTSAEAAVTALAAGADMLLMPDDFESAYSAVVEAIENGTLSEDRIDESLRRIIKIKLEMAGS